MKCHKLEINIRKELQRQLQTINAKIKQEESYLTRSYDKGDRAYTQNQLDILKAKKEVLTHIMRTALNNIN